MVEDTSKKSSNYVNFNLLFFEPNEFTDKSDPVGFLEDEGEEYKFLTPGTKEMYNYVSDK